MPYLKIDPQTEETRTLFITLKIVKDLHIFISRPYFDILLNSLRYCCDNKGLHIYAYTILINHLHLVFWIEEGVIASSLLRDFKKFTANRLLVQLKLDRRKDILEVLRRAAVGRGDRNFRFWKKACHPEGITTDKFLIQKINYVDFNAVKHGVIDDIEKYPYTSYHNHYCKHSVIFDRIEEIKI